MSEKKRSQNRTSVQSSKYETLPPMERIGKSALDALANETMLWIEEQVKVGVPFALNMLKEGLKEAVKALSEKSEPVSDGILNIREATYWDGLEHGEKRKEIAMIAGMTQIGLEKNRSSRCWKLPRMPGTQYQRIKKRGAVNSAPPSSLLYFFIF